MGIFDRFRKKSAESAPDQAALTQLLQWLGVDYVQDKGVLSEATYYACLKVLSEAIGKLPLRLMQSTPDRGVVPQTGHRFYRMLYELPTPEPEDEDATEEDYKSALNALGVSTDEEENT